MTTNNDDENGVYHARNVWIKWYGWVMNDDTQFMWCKKDMNEFNEYLNVKWYVWAHSLCGAKRVVIWLKWNAYVIEKWYVWAHSLCGAKELWYEWNEMNTWICMST